MIKTLFQPAPAGLGLAMMATAPVDAVEQKASAPSSAPIAAGRARKRGPVPQDHAVTLELPGGDFSATTLDINVGGILLQVDGPARVGDRCQIHLLTALGLRRLPGEVVHARPGKVGIRFQSQSSGYAAPHAAA